MQKKAVILLLLVLLPMALFASESGVLLKEGMNRYSSGDWQDAIVSLRRVLAQSPEEETRSEALYWIALSEIALGDYQGAWNDLDTLIDSAPANKRAEDAIYQKGRILYYQTKYEAAITALKTYMDMVKDPAKVSAASYWVGESLFALGRLDEARALFSMITERWPSSVKYEAASYRISLIDQKAVEQELLTLLKWTHEESLKTLEEYQKRERSYEQAIVVYQKRIADMLKDTRLADIEAENRTYKQRISELEEALSTSEARQKQETDSLRKEISRLEARQAPSAKPDAQEAALDSKPAEKDVPDDAAQPLPTEDESSKDDVLARLEALRLQAIEVQNALLKKMEQDGSHE